MGIDSAWVGRPGAGMAWIHLRVGQTLRGSTHHPVLQIVLEGRVQYRLGARVTVTAPAGSTVLLPADQEVTVVRQPGRYLHAQVSRESFERALSRGQYSHMRCVVTRPILLRPPPDELDRLEAVLFAFAMSIKRDARADDRALCSWLARAAQNSGHVLRMSTTSLARLERLDRWIDRHLDEPIVLNDLCRAAGCGPRLLQMIMTTRHARSPLEYVRQRRLAAVRRQLLDMSSRGVTDAALAAGLSHLGRLAGAYRQLFGESPVDTLRNRSASMPPP